LERTVQQLSATPSTKVTGANLERQAKCSEQARKVFADLGYDAAKDLASYESHYNSQMNKCFIDIDHLVLSRGRLHRVRDVSDAFEGKQYGTFMEGVEPNKPFICEVTLTSGEKPQCQSSDEFDEVVKTYMQEGH
jgi:hypothetical protein